METGTLAIIAIIVIIFLVVVALIYFYNQRNKDPCPDKNVCQICKGDSKNCERIMNHLYVMVSRKRSIVVLDGVTLVDDHSRDSNVGGKDGLNVVVIDRNKMKLKTIVGFKINNWIQEIYDFVKFVDRYVAEDDIVIVFSQGPTFEIPLKLLKKDYQIVRDMFNRLVMLGKKGGYIDEDSNYLLIGSKKRDVYWEGISNKTLFYPMIKIESTKCIKDPYNIYPPKEYQFFRDGGWNEEEWQWRCAMESAKRGLYKFGMGKDTCIPLTERDEKVKLDSMEKSDKCVNNIGGEQAITKIGFRKIVVDRDEDGIVVYEKPNFQGKRILLVEGEHTKPFGQIGNSIFDVGSMKIPEDYMVYLVPNMWSSNNLDGPMDIEDMSVYGKIRIIKVQKYKKNTVKFCDKNGKCFIYGPGRHVLDPFLYTVVDKIRRSPSTKRVILFTDSDFQNFLSEHRFGFLTEFWDWLKRLFGIKDKDELRKIVRSLQIE